MLGRLDYGFVIWVCGWLVVDLGFGYFGEFLNFGVFDWLGVWYSVTFVVCVLL